MKVGDIVNIKSSDGYWKGKIVNISEGWLGIPYLHPIASIEEIGGCGRFTAIRKNLEFREGEYWNK